MKTQFPCAQFSKSFRVRGSDRDEKSRKKNKRNETTMKKHEPRTTSTQQRSTDNTTYKFGQAITKCAKWVLLRFFISFHSIFNSIQFIWTKCEMCWTQFPLSRVNIFSFSLRFWFLRLSSFLTHVHTFTYVSSRCEQIVRRSNHRNNINSFGVRRLFSRATDGFCCCCCCWSCTAQMMMMVICRLSVHSFVKN